MRFLIALGWLVVLPLLARGSQVASAQLPDGLYAVFQLERGAFVVELNYDIVPLTVANFVGLAEGTIPNSVRGPGEPFYDGLTFHRVVPGFVAQGGDPLGNGAGDPGYTFPDEFSPHLKHDAVGVLAMANGGPNTNGCQFYFTLSPVTRLDYKHSVFGRIVQGVELLAQIEPDEVIRQVEIMRRGEAAEGFRPSAESFRRMRASAAAILPRDPVLPPLLANDSSLALPAWYEPWINEKLHHYAAVTGVTIHVRLVPRMIFPPAADGDAMANPLRFAHKQWAGSDPDAATLLYVVDENRWRVWIGDSLLHRFALTPETAAGEAGGGVLRDLRQRVLENARALLGVESMHRSIDAAVADLIGELDAAGR